MKENKGSFQKYKSTKNEALEKKMLDLSEGVFVFTEENYEVLELSAEAYNRRRESVVVAHDRRKSN